MIFINSGKYQRMSILASTGGSHVRAKKTHIDCSIRNIHVVDQVATTLVISKYTRPDIWL